MSKGEEQSDLGLHCFTYLLHVLQIGQQTQLLHVFQEQLLTGKMSKGDTASTMEAIVDLRNLGSFEELFYLVVLEKNKDSGSTVHMWKMTIASQAGTVGEGT